MLAVLLLNRMSTERRLALKKRAARTEKLQRKGSVTDYCRTCLSTESLVPIFSDKDTEEKRRQDLSLVTGLEIRSDDGLSQKICSKCTAAVSFVLQFRRTSRKAEKTLLGMAGGTTRLNKKYKLQKEATGLKSELDAEVDCSYDMYGDDFQNDDYEFKEPDKPHIKQEARPRKKRPRLPHATSYKCNTCNKEFRMKATYKAHMRFHTNFCVCESCGKRCRNNNQLQEHKRARHGLGRIHKCAYCEYSSATKEALTIHERRHTGERPYICDHCGAAFHRRSNLVQHIAIHLPEKNFQCDMCPKRLKSKKFLQIHKHNAHTGKRYGYLCGVCAHRFEKPNKVRAHTRRVHGLPDDQQGPVARVQL